MQQLTLTEEVLKMVSKGYTIPNVASHLSISQFDVVQIVYHNTK